MSRLSNTKAYILLEVAAAGAIFAIAALALSAALTTAAQISQTSRAVTHARLLAQSHLEMAYAGVAPTHLHDHHLTSALSTLDQDGQILWQVQVSGPNLHEPVGMVGGP